MVQQNVHVCTLIESTYFIVESKSAEVILLVQRGHICARATHILTPISPNLSNISIFILTNYDVHHIQWTRTWKDDQLSQR